MALKDIGRNRRVFSSKTSLNRDNDGNQFDKTARAFLLTAFAKSLGCAYLLNN